jgi:hypothetical protein
MKIAEFYTFKGDYFDKKGRRENDGISFRDIVKGFEEEFHKKYAPYYANCFVANLKTMMYLERSFRSSCGCSLKKSEKYHFGGDVINGELTFDVAQKMADAKGRTLTGGIDVYYDEEPLWLFTDSDMLDNTVKLMYMPVSDDDDEDEAPIPVGFGVDVRKKVLV